MSNSKLISYTKISPNRTSPRNHKIDTITIHCMSGELSHKTCADWFSNPGCSASANYCIGKDGKISLAVDEGDRSWASSNRENDHRAVTIEVSSLAKEPFTVSDAAYNSLIKLVADICDRNDINKLVWSNSKDDRVNHRNGCNMTVHRDYNTSKSCPGSYLYGKMSDIAAKVNDILHPTIVTVPNKKTTTTESTKPASTSASTYVTTAAPNGGELVKVIEPTGLTIRKGPGTNYASTGSICKYGVTYTITAYSGTWGKLKSGIGWINCSSKYVTKVTTTTSTAKTTTAATSTVATTTAKSTASGKPVYTVGKNYKLLDEIKVYKGAGTNYAIKKYSELTTAAKKYDKDKDGALDKGTTVTCQEIKNVGNDIWMRIPSGWIRVYYNGTKFAG